MKDLETKLFKKPINNSFGFRSENQRTLGKPTEASLDWKPNARKCRDQESNPGLIGKAREDTLR